MHHKDDDLSDLLIDTIVHLFDLLDSLQGKKLSFILLLMLKAAAPHEKPAHEDIGLLRFHIKFHAELLAARQHCSIRFWLNIGDRKWDRIRGHGSALFVEIFQFFSILQLAVKQLHH